MSRRGKVLGTLVFAVLAVAAALAGVLVSRPGTTSDADASTASSSSSVSPGENLATGQEGVDHDADETAAEAEPATDTANPESGQTLANDAPVQATGSSVPVTVTFHGWRADVRQVLVGGYVPGVVESGGTCTLTLTKGAATVSADTQATADAASTACGAVVVPGDRLTAGTWKAVLSYSSPMHAGASGAVAVEVTP
jgi:hypothetical protein